MKKNKYFESDRLIIFIVIFLTVYQTAAVLGILDTFYFPDLRVLTAAAKKMFIQGDIYHHSYVTLKRFILGFLLGASLGYTAALSTGISKTVKAVVEPVIYILYPIPRFLLLPLFLILFGSDDIGRILFICFGSFFMVSITCAQGIKYIEEKYFEIARHYGASRYCILKRILIPGSLPSLFTGMRVSLSITLSFTVVVEFLTSMDGLGAMMWQSLQSLRFDKLILGVIGISLFNLLCLKIIGLLEKIFTGWQEVN